MTTGYEASFEPAMREALALAAAAGLAGLDVPVGAVVLGPDGSTVARAHNQREERRDPTAHAEIVALRAAAAAAGGWRLDGHTLVVTLECGTCCATGCCHTGPKCWAACWPTSAGRCCATSSPSAGRPTTPAQSGRLVGGGVA